MAMPMTDLEFALAWDPDPALALLIRHDYLSELGQSRHREVRGPIDRARSAWDPTRTGPSYVHGLALEMVGRGFISPAGITAHDEGQKPFATQLANFGIPRVTYERNFHGTTPPAG